MCSDTPGEKAAPSMLRAIARVVFHERDSAGQAFRVFPGMAPQISIEGHLVMCRLAADAVEDNGRRGSEQPVLIELPYGEVYARTVTPGYEFTIQVASRVLGHGIIDEVEPPDQSAA